ncbi:MAG TPA: PrpR N-terminal domain-containing protein [Candidatus Pelethocola excrementipullorum]|nr:PrpR N-terminal domain-containing protein [Candidatus Pelethocola excrementipullorum]
MNHKTRILGIAPYEGLKVLMEQVASKREDIELTVVKGNLDEGQEIVRAMDYEYDVILSRANTADLIRDVTHLPVIDIGISYYDVLHCIRQAKATKKPFVVIGFHAITSIAKSLCELLEEPVEIISIHSPENIKKILKDVKARGYNMIVCDTVPYPHAKLMGLTPILLTTGLENVTTAIDDAVAYYRDQARYLEQISILQKAVSSTKKYTVVFDTEKNVLFSSNTQPNSDSILKKVYKTIDASPQGNANFFINVKGIMYSVDCFYYGEEKKPYYICHITATGIPVTYSKYGIKIFDLNQAEAEYSMSFFSTTNASKELQHKLGQINETNMPVMITGEIGTGKDKAALLLYSKSNDRNNPLFNIDCSLLNDRNWNYLVSNYNSPFMENNNTIYISNIESLDKPKQHQLLSIMTDTKLHLRNKIILSCSNGHQQPIPHIAMRFVNMLSCYVLNMPSLREQADDIHSSATLYLDTLNQQLGKRVTSIQPKAFELLLAYPWPFNMTQFRRVLKEIITETTTPHVTPEVVRKVLEQESKFIVSKDLHSEHSACNGQSMNSINLDQPLHVIVKDIAEYTLDRCGGNQSAAAKKLGIGRTTLWRYLSSEK